MYVPLPIANDSPTTLPWSVSVGVPPPPNASAVGEDPAVCDPVPFVAVASDVTVAAKVEFTMSVIVPIINKEYYRYKK